MLLVKPKKQGKVRKLTKNYFKTLMSCFCRYLDSNKKKQISVTSVSLGPQNSHNFICKESFSNKLKG